MKRPLLVLLLAFSAARLLGQQCVLDTTFGNGGRVAIQSGNNIQRVIALPDSSIQYAWNMTRELSPWDAEYWSLVWNYSQDYDTNHHWGAVQPNGSGLRPVATGNHWMKDMAYRKGMTYLCGTAGVSYPSDRAYVVAIDSTGAVASNWGNNGLHVYDPSIPFGNSADALVAGWGGKVYYCGLGQSGPYVASLAANGVFDGAWNGGDVVAVRDPSLTYSFDLSAIAQDYQGKIVVAGKASVSNGTRVVVLRLMPDGQMDGSFGSGGFAIYDFPSRSYAYVTRIHALDQGRYLVTGHVTDTNTVLADADAFALRIQSNGQPDAGFGTGGWAVHDVLGLGLGDVPVASELLLDGRVLLAGNTDLSAFNHAVVWMALMDTQGNLDTSFGPGGVVQFEDTINAGWKARTLCRHPAGMLYLAGNGPLGASMLRFTFAAAAGVFADDEPAAPAPPFGLYPNPIRSGGTLWVPGTGELPVQLIDLQGRVLTEWPRGGELQLPQVAAGLYLVRAGGTTKRLQVR